MEPEWWEWELVFSGHAERRMERRGLSEVGSVRSEASADRLLIVDFAADGRPIGMEIIASAAVTLDRINDHLRDLAQQPLPEADFAPLRVA